jgi:hypothetical protein
MAEIKIRSLADQVLPSLADCVQRLSQGRLQLKEILPTKEWAMVGAVGNGEVATLFSRHQAIRETFLRFNWHT